MEAGSVVAELSDEEIEALHYLQLGREHLLRSQGALLEFHHELGRGMDHYDAARELLMENGHEELAEDLYGPMSRGPFDGTWSSDIVEEAEAHFYPEVLAAEAAIRDELAEGERHIQERQMEHTLRERAYFHERPP